MPNIKFLNLENELWLLENGIKARGDNDLHMDLACLLWNKLQGWFDAGLLPPQLVIPEDWLHPDRQE
jgi:hypothetical protein